MVILAADTALPVSKKGSAQKMICPNIFAQKNKGDGSGCKTAGENALYKLSGASIRNEVVT